MGYCIASIVKIVNTRVKHLEYVTRVGCADLWAQISIYNVTRVHDGSIQRRIEKGSLYCTTLLYDVCMMVEVNISAYTYIKLSHMAPRQIKNSVYLSARLGPSRMMILYTVCSVESYIQRVVSQTEGS